jgi:hypothetical protein
MQDSRSELRRINLPKLSKKSGQPQKERLEAYETEQKGLISLRYDGAFFVLETTERLFRQFLHALG